MATKLFLRNTQTNGIGPGYYDMVTTAGSSADTSFSVTNTVSGGTEIQCTKTGGGQVLAWVSGRVPAGGFTLTTTDISVWALESIGTANCGGRYRVYKRSAAGVETELGGGPFDDGVEFGTSNTEMTWIGNVTDTAFTENDRLVVKLFITNIGTMGNARTCTLTINGADTTTGDSFFNIAETVTFKTEDDVLRDTPYRLATIPRLPGYPQAVFSGPIIPGLNYPRLTGDNGVLFSQTNTIVPYQQDILYRTWFGPVPIITAAPETVTLDKWFSPLQQPLPTTSRQQQSFTWSGFTPAVTGPTTGNGDVLFSQTNTIVPYSRDILYPSLFTPIRVVTAFETVTVDKWFTPWSMPPAGGSTEIDLNSTGLTPELSFDWYRPLNQPPAGRKLPTYEQKAWVGPVSVTTPETVTMDKWFSPLSQPTRKQTNPAPQPVFVQYTVPSGWFVPLSQPVRTQRNPSGQSVYTQLVALPYDWYKQLNQPVRNRANTPDAFFWSTFTPAVVTPEIVTLDKWFSALSQPQRLPNRQQQQASFVYVPPLSFDWFTSLSQPQKATNRQYQQPTSIFVPVSISWFSNLAQPQRRTTHLPEAFTWSTFTPAPAPVETITVDKWYYQLSQPRRPSIYTRNTDSATEVFFFEVPDVSVPGIGDYQITIRRRRK